MLVVLGEAYEQALTSLMELGYDRDEVVRAMNASFNNPSRAAEYLMTVSVCVLSVSMLYSLQYLCVPSIYL